MCNIMNKEYIYDNLFVLAIAPNGLVENLHQGVTIEIVLYGQIIHY